MFTLHYKEKSSLLLLVATYKSQLPFLNESIHCQTQYYRAYMFFPCICNSFREKKLKKLVIHWDDRSKENANTLLSIPCKLSPSHQNRIGNALIGIFKMHLPVSQWGGGGKERQIDSSGPRQLYTTSHCFQLGRQHCVYQICFFTSHVYCVFILNCAKVFSAGSNCNTGWHIISKILQNQHYFRQEEVNAENKDSKTAWKMKPLNTVSFSPSLLWQNCYCSPCHSQEYSMNQVFKGK